MVKSLEMDTDEVPPVTLCRRWCCWLRCPVRRRTGWQSRSPYLDTTDKKPFEDVHNFTSMGDGEFFDASSELDDHDFHAFHEDEAVDKRGDLPAQLLATLQDIDRRCKGVDGPGDHHVECLLQGLNEKLWVCTEPGCPEVTACVWTRLPGVTKEEIAFAITDVEERLKWDSDSFRSYEIVQMSSPEDPAGGEVIYCVVPAPRPLRDRDMLQKRWTLALPGDGWSMVCQSIKDDALRAPKPEYVRAFTHLSGYLLQPIGQGGCGVELTVISRCDLGGSIPTWAQNLVRRMAKQKPVAWARKLGEHCRSLRAAGGQEVSFLR